MTSDLSSKTIAFIGGGNMGAAIISGLAAKGLHKKNIIVAEPWDVNRKKMDDLGVRTTTNNVEAASGAHIVILAIKPQVAKTVCQELAAAAFSPRNSPLPLIISIAAGVTAASLTDWTKTKEGQSPAIVRVMPNTPALLGEGASGLYASDQVSQEQKAQAAALVGSVSRASEWVDKEELLDVVTALSGSGPAYFFAMVEHLVASATKLGLSTEVATRLATQTCLGAGKMLVQASEPPSQLRKNVTSPNGTTQAALESFEASGFAEIVDKAVQAATDRGEELGRTLGAQ